MSGTAIRAENVRKRFGTEDQILQDASLAVEENEMLVLMGPNGVGKTVLLSCLAGSEPPSSGTVEVLGEPTTGRGVDVSFLLQEAMAIDALTGRENIAFYADLHPRFTDRWQEYVERFEIGDELDKLVKHYSGGMKRKLELAICLSIDAPVYLLDEPTTGLDLSVIQAVHRTIRELRAEGATVVLSSHLPLDAELGDRIAFLRDGAIIAKGSPTELLASLPSVVRATGVNVLDALAEHMIDGRLFEDGGEARGFLRDGVAAEDIVATVGNGPTAVENRQVGEQEPTYTDLFNYYAHLSRSEA